MSQVEDLEQCSDIWQGASHPHPWAWSVVGLLGRRVTGFREPFGPGPESFLWLWVVMRGSSETSERDVNLVPGALLDQEITSRLLCPTCRLLENPGCR